MGCEERLSRSLDFFERVRRKSADATGMLRETRGAEAAVAVVFTCTACARTRGSRSEGAVAHGTYLTACSGAI